MIQPPNYANLFLLAYGIDFIQGLLKNKDRKFAQIFNFGFPYIDDVLSLNNSRFAEYLHHIYPNGLEVEDTIDNQKSASYLDPDLEIINGGRLKTKLYDKGNDFNFPIVKLPLHQ
jgi:hypothetical protein